MRLLPSLLLAGLAAAQLPAPAFPPITFNHQLLAGCAQPQAGQGSNSQRNRMWTDVRPVPNNSPDIGAWVTHETWVDNIQGGYPVVIALTIDTQGSWWGFPCEGIVRPPGTLPSAATGHDKFWLNSSAIAVSPSHQSTDPFGVVSFFIGYQLPSAMYGFNWHSQWIRIDPATNLIFASDLEGYAVTQ